MKESIDALVRALREELTQYGELLALMQEQQELIIDRKAQDLLQNLNQVNDQMKKIAAAREAREAARRALLALVGGDNLTTFREMTAKLPAEYQPLISALVEEINQLLQRVHQWLRQNHLLLRRSLDLMQSILQNIFPTTAATRTYGRLGAVTPVSPPPSTLYEGII